MSIANTASPHDPTLQNDLALYLEVVDYDAMFNTSPEAPIIVNNYDVNALEDKKRLNAIIMTKYEGDALSVVPHCDCQNLSGEHLVGKRCNVCQTVVSAVTEKALQPSLWIAAPVGVKKLIHPHIWKILSMALGAKKEGSFNPLEWLCNSHYRPQNRSAQLMMMESLGVKRGLNYFIDHFDDIINILFSRPGIIKGNRKQKQSLYDFIQFHRSMIFCSHLPFPSRLTFITESAAGTIYTDTTMTNAIDAIRTITSIESAVTPLSVSARESRTVKAIVQLAEYYYHFTSKTAGSKLGLIRQHIVGGRLHFTARAVISSIANNHRHDECVLPWGLSILLLKVHLTNLLMKRGMAPNEIYRLLHEHVNTYHPLLDSMFDELLNSELGINIALGRNPSLARQSIQCFKVTSIRKDPNINTIGMSVLTLKGPNADFDGDELNVTLILDKVTLARMKRLAPYLGLMDLKSPRTISKNLSIPGPIITTINAWRHEGV